MFRALNILLTILMTWFTRQAFPAIPGDGFTIILIFVAWNVVFWLFSFFYNKRAFYKTPRILGLVLFYLKELLMASMKVAYEVITPKDHMEPAVVAVPLDAKSNFEITLLANLVTLTPGTLSIDVSEDRKTLYVHAMYTESGDLDAIRKDIKDGFERRILNITRDQSEI